MYKKVYLIGIYGPLEEGETLYGLCSSVKEFAEFMHIKTSNADQILRMLFKKQTHYIRYSGKLCTVEFIYDIEEDN